MPDAADSKIDIIATRRADEIQKREPIFKLIDDSYVGGFRFKSGGHLEKYPRESTEVFTTRKARSIYFNYLQPIVDILSGFIYRNEVKRDTVPEFLKDFMANASKGKSLQEYMQSLSPQSLCYTVGALVDSPKFDPAEVPNEAARKEKGIKPYICTYYPHQIRDFAVNEDGDLVWVLLDDSRPEKADPFTKESVKTVYRLWTAEFYQDFEIKKNESGTAEVTPGEEVKHPIGYVPFRFISWRDVDSDMIGDSPMEDIALISKQIYNTLSLFDEMLHTGTFKTLFFPVEKANDIGEDIIKKGLYDIAVVPYNGRLSQSPDFKGPGLGDVEAFISAIKMYVYEIFRKIGMDVDRDKSYTQSGKALGKEFQKTEALLKQGSKNMEAAENWFLKTAARWMGKKDEPKVKYSNEFQESDIDVVLERLYKIFNLQLRPIKVLALRRMLSIVFPDLKDEQLDALSQETEGGAPEWGMNSGGIGDLLNMSKSLAKTPQEVKT